MELIYTMNYWNWLMVGLVLLILELSSGTYYILWFGLSALVVGLGMLVVDMSWQVQWTSFTLISLVTSFSWWFYQHKVDKDDHATSTLNQRKKYIVGTRVMLEESLDIGLHRLKLGDTTWSIQVQEPLIKGEEIEIIDMDGIILKVKKINPSSS
tara:strand:- start:6300 stop:6761 length:462 start_codon:yes stop_codon:yes gene_type:complete